MVEKYLSKMLTITGIQVLLIVVQKNIQAVNAIFLMLHTAGIKSQELSVLL